MVSVVVSRLIPEPDILRWVAFATLRTMRKFTQQVHLPQRLHNKIDASGVTVKFGGMMSDLVESDVPAIKLVFRDDSKSVISESNTLTSNATAWTATNSGNVSVPAQTRHRYGRFLAPVSRVKTAIVSLVTSFYETECGYRR